MEHRKEATPAQDLGKSVTGAEFTEMLSCEDSLVIHFMLSGRCHLPAGAIAEGSCRELKTPVKSPGQSTWLVTAPTLQSCLGSVPESRAAIFCWAVPKQELLASGLPGLLKSILILHGKHDVYIASWDEIPLPWASLQHPAMTTYNNAMLTVFTGPTTTIVGYQEWVGLEMKASPFITDASGPRDDWQSSIYRLVRRRKRQTDFLLLSN